jgi:Domain of unknown function (DUF1772)
MTMLATWRFLTLVLAALSMTMTSAHLLELPGKLALSPRLYAAVNATLYDNFARIGAIYILGSILCALVLALLVRKRKHVRGWTYAGAAALVLGLVSWFILVAPVNRAVADAAASAPDLVPELWVRLRHRWEYGHVVGFVFTLAGFCALVISVLRDTRAVDAPLMTMMRSGQEQGFSAP